MGNGYVGAYGAQGGRDALEELVAQRIKETLLKQQEEQRQFQNRIALDDQDISRGHLGVSRDHAGLQREQFDYGKGRDTKADEAAATAAAKRSEVISGLPDWLRGSASAQDVGLNFDPSAFTEAPETRDASDKRRVKLFSIEDGIRTQNAIRSRPPQTRDTEWVMRNGAPVQIQKGAAQPGDTPYDAVSQRQQAGDPKATQEAQDTLAEVNRIATALRGHQGRSGAFGLYQSYVPTMRQDTADAETLLKSLQGLLTLENMGKMKGVLSDADMAILRQASTTLSQQMGDQAADTELDRLIRVSGGSAAADSGSVPPGVSSALSGKGDGRYTLSDGSVWVVQGGQIRKGS